MNKLFSVALSLVMILAVMTACSSHTHTEGENWEADPTGHWKLCGECGEKTRSGEHTLNDESRCTVCGSEIMKWEEAVSVFTYDSHENIIRMAGYDADGNLRSENVNKYEYDDNGCLTKAEEYVDGQFFTASEYTVRDGESILTKFTHYNEDGSKFFNEYDIYGNVTVIIDYDAEGNVNLQSNSRYTENSDGRWYRAACTEIYSDGTKIEEEYEKSGFTTSRVVYDADGSITSTESWEYTYDENGYITTEKAYVEGVLETQTVYKTATDNGNVYSYPETVTTYYGDGSKTVCVYNEFNELVSETNYDASGNAVA